MSGVPPPPNVVEELKPLKALLIAFVPVSCMRACRFGSRFGDRDRTVPPAALVIFSVPPPSAMVVPPV